VISTGRLVANTVLSSSGEADVEEGL
jgi:hypothetical protein